MTVKVAGTAVRTITPTEWEATVAFSDGIVYRRRGQLFELLTWLANVAGFTNE